MTVSNVSTSISKIFFLVVAHKSQKYSGGPQYKMKHLTDIKVTNDHIKGKL